MRAFWDTIRLIILVLLLPVILIFIGPLLILAALRGHQSMGPITWETSDYGMVGRLGVLMLGLALWLLVWSGLAWLFLASTPFQPVLAQILPPTAGPETVAEATLPRSFSPTLTPTETHTPSPTASKTLTPSSTLSGTSTLTPTSSTDASLSAPVTPLPGETPEETPAPEQSPTPTPTVPTSTSTATPTPAATPTPQSTPTLAEREVALATVKEANLLLRDAIALKNDKAIEKLEKVWQGKALTVIENFTTDLSDRYTRPITVAVEYLEPPVLQVQAGTGQVKVTSRESWSYSGPTTVYREAFEFVYSLERAGDSWVITSYTFSNLPSPTPTPTRTPTRRPLPPTPTATLTAAGG